MIRLLRTELTRLRWRRAVIILVAASFALTALIGFTTIWNTRPISADERSQAIETARQDPNFQQMLQDCQAHPRQFGAKRAASCETDLLRGYGPWRSPLNLHDELGSGGTGVATVVLMLLVLMGATFAGADWSSGSMSNQLLFEPRRTRVWLAKVVAVGLVAVAVSAVALTGWWLVVAAAAHGRGIQSAPGVGGEIAWEIARCTFLGGLGAIGGYALTMLVRSTVLTLGTLFALSVASTALILTIPGISEPPRWIIPTNLEAVMRGKSTYFLDGATNCTQDAGGSIVCDNGQHILTVWGGLAYLLVPALIVIALSLVTFRRRDVP